MGRGRPGRAECFPPSRPARHGCVAGRLWFGRTVGEECSRRASMSKRVLILVEGQTEERFTKDVLGPAFWEKQLFFQPTILVTKKVKSGPNFKGGVTNFAKFENDLRRLLNSAVVALVTIIVDYYGLPSEFACRETAPTNWTS